MSNPAMTKFAPSSYGSIIATALGVISTNTTSSLPNPTPSSCTTGKGGDSIHAEASSCPSDRTPVIAASLGTLLGVAAVALVVQSFLFYRKGRESRRPTKYPVAELDGSTVFHTELDGISRREGGMVIR
jgi:hypothetical protein